MTKTDLVWFQRRFKELLEAGRAAVGGVKIKLPVQSSHEIYIHQPWGWVMVQTCWRATAAAVHGNFGASQFALSPSLMEGF